MKKALDIKKEIPNSIILNQFENESNPKIHFKTTAKEIWDDCEGNIDYLISGVGTGGQSLELGGF